MPSAEESKEMFNALVDNGLSLLQRAVRDIENEPHHAVIDFAAGLELLLKARLFHEHWSLVGEKPHNTGWAEIKSGRAKSIGGTSLVDALSSVLDAQLHKRCKDTLKSVIEHRNRSVHFVPDEDFYSIAQEQYRCWQHVLAVFEGSWKEVFSGHTDRIQQVNKSFHTLATFLETKYEEIKASGRLEGFRKAGTLLTCGTCGLEAVVVQDVTSGYSIGHCEVCQESMHVGQFSCNHWLVLPDDFTDEIECKCGSQHGPSELAKQIAPPKTHDELLCDGDGVANCGECLQAHTVAPHGAGYVCVACHREFDEDSISECEFCNDSWAGMDLTDSYFEGCEFCDGRGGQGWPD